jgi:hypothetical protein
MYLTSANQNEEERHELFATTSRKNSIKSEVNVDDSGPSSHPEYRSNPILILVELIGCKDGAFHVEDLTVEFAVTYRSSVDQLRRSFSEVHCWRLFKDSYADTEEFSDWFEDKLKQMFSRSDRSSDTSYRLFTSELWLYELNRLIEQLPNKLSPTILNQLDKLAHLHFMYLYERKSQHSVNWFCFCRWLTTNFLAYALAAQYVRELIKIVPEVLDSVAARVCKLFSALYELEPCGAPYKGLGYAKDHSSLCCHQPRKDHTTHKTSRLVYGRSKFMESLGLATYVCWDGNFESICAEQPDADELKQVMDLIQCYAEQLLWKQRNKTVVYRAILNVFNQSSIDFDGMMYKTNDLTLAFLCLCCLAGTTKSIHGVCNECWLALMSYSKYATGLKIPQPSAYPERGTCIMCMLRQCDHCILPCGHLAFCQRCADKLVKGFRQCAICQCPAHDKMKVTKLSEHSGTE